MIKVVNCNSIIPKKITIAVVLKTSVIKQDTVTIDVFVGERLFCDYNILIGTIVFK